MKPKDKTKTFIMILNRKNPLISIVYVNIFYHCKDNYVTIIDLV